MSDDAALNTLVFDVGGTGLKATVLDSQGHPEHDRVRVDTTYPSPPEKLVADLVGLTKGLPPYQRVSVGFPGVVRDGHVVTAPHFVTAHGPGTRVKRCWSRRGRASIWLMRLAPPSEFRSGWPTTRTCRAPVTSPARGSNSSSRLEPASARPCFATVVSH